MMEALQHWHHIVKSRDCSTLFTLLAPEVVFHSPVVHTPQVGSAITAKYLCAAVHVFGNESFTYLREFKTDSQAVLEFTTTIDGVVVNGVDIITWNKENQISEFKVMVRPLKAMQIIHEQMGRMLSKERATVA